MANPKTATVRFNSRTFLASRPEVLAVVRTAEIFDWGYWIEFVGTSAELTAAGVACAEMFDMGDRGQQTRRDEFGDEYTISIMKNDRFKITRRFHSDEYQPEADLPRAPDALKRKRWLEGRCAADAATAEILERLARPATGAES